MPPGRDPTKASASSAKRLLIEVNTDSQFTPDPDRKRLRQQPTTDTPTPPPSTSLLTLGQICHGDTAQRRTTKRSSLSQTSPRTRALEPPLADCWPPSKRRRQYPASLDEWLEDNVNRARASGQEEELRDITAIASTEASLWPQDSVAPSEAVDEQMCQKPTLTVSAHTERLDPTSSAHWGTLKRNGVVLDQTGRHIAAEVRKLIDRHIRKRRNSPRLDDESHAKIKNLVIKAWHKAEATVSEIIKSPLFDLGYPDLTEGGNTPWTKQPVPNKPNAPLPILNPRPDKHFGFPLVLDSEWTDEQLSVADHAASRPYTQPSRENMFPCLMFELKSEATKGNLYAAEAQAAAAGAHRVASLLWLLDEVEPGRERASTDALVFSSVVSQRQAVAYVHFYSPADQTFYMSFIDSFYFAKEADAQGCRNHHKNVAEWMLDVVQPVVRDLLTQAHPVSETWKKGRSVGAMAGTTESFAGDGHLSKRRRTESDRHATAAAVQCVLSRVRSRGTWCIYSRERGTWVESSAFIVTIPLQMAHSEASTSPVSSIPGGD